MIHLLPTGLFSPPAYVRKGAQHPATSCYNKVVGYQISAGFFCFVLLFLSEKLHHKNLHILIGVKSFKMFLHIEYILYTIFLFWCPIFSSILLLILIYLSLYIHVFHTYLVHNLKTSFHIAAIG